jgi:O-antigen/teichoic acid export membrane protein
VSSFSRYLGNTSWLLSERVFRVGLTLIISVLLARYLGPELFGQFSYAISVVALLSFLNELGLDSVLVKELVDHPEQRDRIKGTAFVMKLAGTCLLCLLLVPLCLSLNNEPVFNLYITIIALGFFAQCFVVIDYEFQSRVQSKYVAFSLLAQSTIGATLKIACILYSAPLLYIVIVQVLESVVLALGLIYFHHLRSGSLRAWSFDSAIARRLFSASWPLMLSGAAVTVYMKIDQVMIKAMLSTADVGLYGIAVRISETVYFIPGVVAGSLFPAIIAARGSESYQKKLQNLYDLLVWMAVLIAIPTTILAPYIVIVLFGEAYAASAEVLMLHIWAAIFVFFGLARGKWIVNEGLQRYVLFFTIAGAVINVLLNYLLIPLQGISGAAMATLFGVAVAAVGAPLLLTRTRISSIMFLRSFNLWRVIREGKSYLP